MDYYGSQYLFQQLYNNKKTMVVTFGILPIVSAHNGLFQGDGYKRSSSHGYLY
jgi:hypothetical protein